MATEWDDDERLLADLGAALRAGRDVPERFVNLGKAAFAWHSVDAELAALTYDSATSREPTGTRGEPASLRALTFATSRVVIELEVTADSLYGQVVPAGAGELEVVVRGGESRTVSVDEMGWFVVSPRPVGLFRLRVDTGEGDVLTEWTAV